MYQLTLQFTVELKAGGMLTIEAVRFGYSEQPPPLPDKSVSLSA